MRQRFIVPIVVAAAASFGLNSARADQVEIKGLHLCCGRCVTDAQNVLKKIDGLTDVKVDQKAKAVTFTAKDAKTAAEGYTALFNAGYHGTVTQEGKAVVVKSEKVEGKANELTIQSHICCGSCKTAIKGLYPDVTVSFPATNVFKLEGKDLDKGKILETLQKAGFNGTIGK